MFRAQRELNKNKTFKKNLFFQILCYVLFTLENFRLLSKIFNLEEHFFSAQQILQGRFIFYAVILFAFKMFKYDRIFLNEIKPSFLITIEIFKTTKFM